MKLDGFRKTDLEKVAKGVERTYRVPAPYGPKGGPAKIKVRFAYAGTGNANYQAALGEAGTTDERLEALYDHCILDWSTDIQSGGEALEPTKENFFALAEFDADEIQTTMTKIMGIDVFNRQLFVEKKRAASEKN